jgi:ATP-dependent DNA helicase RecG
MTPADFEHLIDDLLHDKGEREWVEFKHNNDKPDLIGEYLSALSNSAALHGEPYGYILWGVEDGTHNLVGTTFRPRATKISAQELENWLTVKLDPQVEFTIHEYDVRGVQTVLFRVRAASHTPVRFGGTEYIRVGSYKKKLADHPEHERRLWTLFSTAAFEDGFAAVDLPASEVLRLLDHPGYFRLLRQPTPGTDSAVLERLSADKLIVARGGDRYTVTNCGAVLFARRLGDFGRIGRKAVRVIRYRGRNRLVAISEEEFGSGFAVAFESITAYLKAVLPQVEGIGSALRETVHSYPELAVRELLANTLIHQDFSLTGTGPMVEIFDDRVEFTNPGVPLINTQRFIDHSPQSRNEKLAGLMRRMNMCEERGSGIDKVISRIEEEHLPPPDFTRTESHTRATLYARKPFKMMNPDERVRACYQHACLCHVSNLQMSNSTLRERFGLAQEQQALASRVLKETLQAALIKEYVQASRSTRDKKYLPFWA